MEIERKWMVSGWPDQIDPSLPLLFTEYQEQGYVHAQAPIVRVRLEARKALADLFPENRGASAGPDRNSLGNISEDCPAGKSPLLTDMVASHMSEEDTNYVLCFKSRGLLSRKEIEMALEKERYLELKDLIEKPLIRKVRNVYALPDGLRLEVNLVDEGLKTEFMYAEVEFESEQQANAWNPDEFSLGAYLNDDVTQQPGQSMSAYWMQTRP